MIEIQYNYQYTDKAHNNWVENGGTDQGRDQFIEWDRTILSWYPALGGRSGDIVNRKLAKLKPVDFQTIMSIRNGDVKNYMPWIKMLPGDLQNEVPVGVPNRMKTVIIDDSDPENIITEEQVKTWDEWIQPKYTKNEIDGYMYFLSHSGNFKGSPLKGSELILIYNLEYAELTIELPVIGEP